MKRDINSTNKPIQQHKREETPAMWQYLTVVSAWYSKLHIYSKATSKWIAKYVIFLFYFVMTQQQALTMSLQSYIIALLSIIKIILGFYKKWKIQPKFCIFLFCVFCFFSNISIPLCVGYLCFVFYFKLFESLQCDWYENIKK